MGFRDKRPQFDVGPAPAVVADREQRREMDAFKEDMDLDTAVTRKYGHAVVPDFTEVQDQSTWSVKPDADTEDWQLPAPLDHSLGFLCGAAGTGKTYLARQWVKNYPGVVLAATTGIAAVNLGEGTTINALLGYFDTDSLKDSYISGFLTARFGKLFKAGVRRILCDEVSMMDAHQLTFIVRALEELKDRAYARDVMLAEAVTKQMEEEGADPETQLPIGFTLIGDFCQLPPVKAPFAFESDEWPKVAAHTHLLTEIRRQADRPFIETLMAARRGDAPTVVDFFSPTLQRTMDHHFDGTTIYATNDAVDRYNRLRMDEIAAAAREYRKVEWGDQRGDWKKAIPEALTLKPGALVMILANKRDKPLGDGMPGPLIYANGDLGHVKQLDSRRAYITLLRNGETVEVEMLERQNTVPVDADRKKAMREKGEAMRVTDDGRFEVIGTVSYLPVRVAYATTVHKSQGLSLDRVQINTTEHMFKQPGMLYVALSRARTAEGLRLVGTADGLRTRCTVHGKVRAWV